MKLWVLFLSCLFCFTMMPAWAAVRIEVANVQDLVARIGSHRELHLAPGTYDLGDVTKSKGMNAQWIRNGGLFIHGVQDFKLVGSGINKTKIVSPFAECDVLSFVECSDIMVKGLQIGHVVIPGGCQGAAVYIRDSHHLGFVDTDIYGCGQYSLSLRTVADISVKDSKLHDCSYGLIDALAVTNGTFVNTLFKHTGKESAINTNGATSMTFEKCGFYIDPNRKAYSYERIPIKEYVTNYSLCSKPKDKPWKSNRQLTFKNCTFTNVSPEEQGKLGVRSQEAGVSGWNMIKSKTD